MRSLIAMAIFLASFASAAASDYEETRDLTVDASGVETLVIDVGAGSLDVAGVDGLGTIEVTATIVIPDVDADDGRQFIEKNLVLTLERHDHRAKLTSEFDGRFWGSNSNGRVDLEVRAPSTLAVSIDDGSGSMDISNFSADVSIDDGSGSIDVQNVGALKIDDGSGSIDVSGVTGDVYVNDGSGEITVNAVSGSVTIDDGSGSIRVSDVAEDLIIVDDGSGSVSFSDIRGTVDQEG
jgi:hypothetical protein